MDNQNNKNQENAQQNQPDNVVRIMTNLTPNAQSSNQEGQGLEEQQNVNNQNNYQNPQKIMKTDENCAGMAVNPANTSNSNMGNTQNQDGQNFNVPSSVSMNIVGNQRQQTESIGLQHKHGSKGNSQCDGTSMNQPSHAHGSHTASHHNEHKQEEESDEAYSDDPKSRTSASSRVNFSKLTAEEKERRCHNMSKEVKQLRRKIRNMEERLARSNVSIDYPSGHVTSEGSHDHTIHKARDKLKSYKGYELPDQKDIVDNLASALAHDRLRPDTMPFYMICTLVRAHLSQDQLNKYDQEVNQIDESNKDSGLENKEIVISLPEKEVRISRKEFQHYAPFHENEQIMRLLTGQIKEDNNQMAGMNPGQQTNAQMDLLNSTMQSNSQNMNMMQNMQNLLNNPVLSSLANSMNTQGSPAGMGGMNNQMQNQYSSQMLSNLVNASMQNPNWNMNNNMQNMGQNYPNISGQSLNDLIQSQMMNFNSNGGGYMSQDQTPNNQGGGGGNNQNQN